MRYFPDTRKREKRNVKSLYKPLEMVLGKTAEKYAKDAQAVLPLFRFGTTVH